MPDLSHLPQLDSDYRLTTDQIAQYRRDGHILLRGVASPAEAAAYEPSISAAVERFMTEMRPLAERDTYGKAFLQVMNLWVRDEAVRRYVMARRFAKIAADLMGVKRRPHLPRSGALQGTGRRTHPLASGRILLAARYRQHADHVDAARGYRGGDGHADFRVAFRRARLPERDPDLR